MASARTWIGLLLLRSPASLRLLRKLPLLGNLIHGLSYRLLPAERLVWARVETGPGRACGSSSIRARDRIICVAASRARRRQFWLRSTIRSATWTPAIFWPSRRRESES
jgi:hypothetical protein